MSIRIGRRRVLGLTATLLSGMLPAQHVRAQRRPATEPPRIVLSERNAVTDTIYGKVRGYTESGVHTFKGIPYGDTTSGMGRFMTPRPLNKWAGIRDCLDYGPVCPQLRGDRSGTPDHIAFMFQAFSGFHDENGLNLNVWTPAVGNARARPVLVWLHGGGFFGGSSFEFPSYDREKSR